MTDDKTQTDEQAFDALLTETLGGMNPPDLSGIVLERLENDRESSHALFVEPLVHDQRRKAAPSGLHWKVVTAGVAIAATLLWFVIGPGLRRNSEQSPKVALEDDGDAQGAVSIAVEQKTQPEADPPKQSREPLRGIPLLVDGNQERQESGQTQLADTEKSSSQPLEKIATLSSEIEKSFFQYWKSVGVTPTPDATISQIAERLRGRLGVVVPAEILNNSDDLQSYFAKQSNATKLASAWLSQMTHGGVRRLSEDNRLELTNELAKCIEGTLSVDRTLLSWIEGQNPRSEAFHHAIGSFGSVSKVNHLAGLTMNVDLRCVRCHDAKIQGAGKQSEYWEFVALLKNGSAGKPEKATAEKGTRSTQRSTFYELADGRQKLAEPKVSQRWLSEANQSPVQSVKAWADALSGSPALARGVVNSIWELVHGLPLRGRVVDPVTAPHDDNLDSIETRLANDLINSNFNLARTLALVVASPVSRRAVPEVFQSTDQLLTDSAARKHAIDSINAFAAAAPVTKRVTIAQRVDQAKRSIGVKIDSGKSFVAQASDSTGNQKRKDKQPATPLINDDFPTDGSSLPVQWLRLLSEQDSRVNHLAYLAGLDQLPASIGEVVEVMDNETNEQQNLVLQRVWWMLRP